MNQGEQVQIEVIKQVEAKPAGHEFRCKQCTYTNSYELVDVKKAKCGICEEEDSEALAKIKEALGIVD